MSRTTNLSYRYGTIYLLAATIAYAVPSPDPSAEPAKEEVSAQPPEARPPAPKQEVQKIEVTTQRSNATEERRESAAAKIVVGREEIEKFGDSNLSDVLRRLPGVTLSSGGVISMRGMGAGFTQILIDGERVAPGFSIEQLSPDQVERIEILRAPTAETGARAIAGTINIILRKPRRIKQDDLKASLQTTLGRLSGEASLSRNDSFSPTGTYNMTLSARHNDNKGDSVTRATTVNTRTGNVDLDQLTSSKYDTTSRNVSLSSQVQWKLGEGEQFVIQPFLTAFQFKSGVQDTLTQLAGANPPSFATRDGHFGTIVSNVRFTSTLTKRIDEDTRFELRGGAGRVTRRRDSNDKQFDADRVRVLTQSVAAESSDVSWNLSGKITRNLFDKHKLVGGAEIESVKRVDRTVTLLNDVPQLTDFSSELDISTRRIALYAQDEWDPAENWSAYAGLRWEEIDTRSNATVTGDSGAVRNRSRVLTPLAHGVWRFNAPKKDQIRLSLTQSYNSPSLFTLVPRPTLDTLYPVPGPNVVSNPDFAGNPALKPERANGIDLAFEHYLSSSGVISVSLFSRRIKDLIRQTTQLESVPWATTQRFVNRPRNLGTAVSNGIEFDAKFQLTELIASAIPLDLRLNLSLFNSKVDAVPGPNNRINGQPKATGNLGADYRFRDRPFTVGGNIAFTPAYSIQNTDTQRVGKSSARVIDFYGLWAISQATKLRLTLSNLAPRDNTNTVLNSQNGQQVNTINNDRSAVSVGLKLEMRL